MTVDITYFIGDQRNTDQGEISTMEFKDFANKLSVCKKGKKHHSYFVRGILDPIERKDANLESSNLIVIDGDEGIKGRNAPKPLDVHKAMVELNLNHCLYTSHSHSAEKNKFRIVIPCNKMIKVDLKVNIQALLDKLTDKGIRVKNVTEMSVWSQPWFLPTRDDPEDGLFEFYESHEGVDWRVIVGEAAEVVKEKVEVQSNSLEDWYENIRTGAEYHESMLGISYQLIKDGMSEAHVIAMLNTLLNASEDAGTERWQTRVNEVDRTVKGAVYKIDLAKKEEVIVSAPPRSEAGTMPVFPYGVLNTWPEPWPAIFYAYHSVAREPVEELLIPTILASCAHSLKNNYVTMEDKLLSFVFLSLADSGVGKDANTTSILKELSSIFVRASTFLTDDPFSKFSGNFAKSITSDTAFMESFDENGDFLWVNTEATRIFDLISSKGNSSVSAISDKIVEVGDGGEITAKRKAGAKDFVVSQQNPNCQILMCAQPETISDHLNHAMIDSGLFGRPLITVSDKKRDLKKHKMFKPRKVRDLVLEDDFIKLFTHLNMLVKTTHIRDATPLGLEGEDTNIMNDWYLKKLAPIMESDKTLEVALIRMGIQVEQLYALVLAFVRENDILLGRDLTPGFDFDLLIPLLDYWVDCKVYATQHLVSGNADPLCSAIIEIMRDMLEGKIKVSKSNQLKAIKEDKVPIAKLSAILPTRRTLIKELEMQGDAKALQTKLKYAINSLIDLGVITSCLSGQTACIAFID